MTPKNDFRVFQPFLNLPLAIETYDLSIHQGLERAGIYKEIEAELESLLTQLGDSRRVTDLLELARKRYPELQMRMPTREQIHQITSYDFFDPWTEAYTKAKTNTKNSGYAFFAKPIDPEELELYRKALMIQAESESHMPRDFFEKKSRVIAELHRKLNADPSKPLFVIPKTTNFETVLHELIHYIQYKKDPDRFYQRKSITPQEIVFLWQAKQKALSNQPLTSQEKKGIKLEALSEVEVGQLLLKHLGNTDTILKDQNPYTLLWLHALEKPSFIPYHPQARRQVEQFYTVQKGAKALNFTKDQ